ncbi:uncharacterized protein LOC115623826 [Scaptodrosophila lebanonensis]|uniref:carboxylesterase n=1 Tax=Drosophila lebanonensis TaxID=7225 RepID=A0A6J2TE02_DROLE|nr:uncharacterized protein LOC115623826 [Scaptodrosophila lebanonensis]
MATSLDTYELALPLGQIRGVKRRTIYDDEYYSFERLPFAKPPIGELRFKAPQPAGGWQGVLDCTNYAAKPVQKSFLNGQPEGSEDCLYLNVYAKRLNSEKPLPVIVYIYGGSFSVGEATRELYSPDYFMAKDVVLVTLNYRVDCLGFLSLNDPSVEIPGNAGLKDQVLALKWVKQYVEHFNGDTNNITVCGESAGGCSTHYMMCTEQTRGLFHKAIPMSGTVLNYWANTPPADFAYRLAKLYGYNGENVDKQVLAHLRSLEAYQLVNHNLLTEEDRRLGLICAFGATVESYVGPDCVVPGPQLEMVRSAWSNDLPVMLGGTSFEGLFIYPELKANTKATDHLFDDPVRVVPHDVSVQNTQEENLKYSERMIRAYFGNEKPSSALLFNFLDYYSYKIFWHGIYRSLLARLKYARAPTYFYRFDFDSPDFNFYRKLFCGDDITKGVAHADDLPYLFFNLQAWKLDKSSAEYKTIQRMVGMWTAFATSSNPNCEEIAPINWKPSKAGKPQEVLNISHDVSIIDLPEFEKLKLWNSLYKEEELYIVQILPTHQISLSNLNCYSLSAVRLWSEGSFSNMSEQLFFDFRSNSMTADYSETSPVVKTTHGRIRGILLQSLYDEPFYAFDGVPYAAPPVGALRFKAPYDIRPWYGIRDCSQPQDKCLQVSSYTKQVEGSEDCLYLNISVKTLHSEKPLPIMVYLHGGGYKGGDPSRRAWGPDYFMQQQVIFVSIGHRLGPFGFLSFADPSLEVPGNAGLKDIVLGLQWIKANASNFNGDPHNITLFGHSSGAGTAHLLMQSPRTELLFNKAILMAGFMTETNRLPNMEYRLAKHLGYEGENNDVDVYNFIKQADPKLVASAEFWTPEERAQGLLLAFTPCVEPYNTPSAVLLAEPIELQRSAWSNNIPLILGTTSSEGLYVHKWLKDNPAMLNNFRKYPEQLLPRTLQKRCDVGQKRELGKSLLQYFLAGQELSLESVDRLVDLYSYSMLHSQQRVVHARGAYGRAPTYLYRFDFDSPDFNFYRVRFHGPEMRGVGHVDELGYIFVIPATFKLDATRPEYATILRMVAMFTEFALKSDPNAPLTQSLVDWKPIARFGQRHCLNISHELQLIAQPEPQKLKFFDQLLDTYELALPLGQIRGVKRLTIYDDDYYSFERLPFAKPPIGELRFKAPQPAGGWQGVLDCTNYAAKPVQKGLLTGKIEGSEDCLYLNVYAKRLNSEKPLPVIVYIYGGAFSVGEATRELYSPDYFMAKDVVLVTLNYRVDCLGFLSLNDPSVEIPGNAGLKDQVLALKWVKQYIEHFNGDTNNITVCGESAGGCSTHYMMCTEQTRGLFHKAIPMSGTVLNYWANTPPADFAYRLAKLYGYNGENVDKQVLDHLRSLEAHKLVNHSLLTAEDRRNGLIYAFGPTVESYVGPDCVVPGSQLEMARSAWSNDLPVMLGGTSFEGLFMYPGLKANTKAMDNLLDDPVRVVPHDVRVQHTQEENLKYSERMIRAYFGNEKPSSALLFNFLDFYSYKIFWHGIYRSLLARLKYARAPTYFYRFDFDSPDFNFYRKKYCGEDITKGVAHADDLPYLFFNLQAWKLDKSSAEYKTIQRMVGMWTAFATSSNPNCEEIAPINWKPSKAGKPQEVLNISHDVSIIDLPEFEKLKVWDSLYKQEELY